MTEPLPRPWGIASMQGRTMRQPTGGIVRPGEKNEKGWARELDYFNCEDAPALKAIYGDKPKMIRGIFGSNDVRAVIDLGYKKWHQNNTIACRGDGHRAVDLDEGKEIDCLGEDCPRVQGEKDENGKLVKSCKRGIDIAFIPTDAPTIAVHTFHSSGWRTIENTLAFVDLLQALFGRIAGIPWVMIREPYKCTRTTDDGKKVNQIHHTIRFDLEKPIGEITPIFVPTYERPAALDQAQPEFYPPAAIEAGSDGKALPPAPEVVVIEQEPDHPHDMQPCAPVPPLAAVPEPETDPQRLSIIKGFEICGIPEDDRPKFWASYEGHLPELEKYLSSLLDSQLVETHPQEAPKAEAPKPETPAAGEQGKWSY